jgi:xanthine dehydrogenase accessory factor
MLVFGAVDHAAALAAVGHHIGYHVTVCDARAVFATPQRFPAADEVVVDWPHRYLANTETDERTVVCVLTHDPKFDVPVLVEALRRPLAYVGALGSRRTTADRLDRLRAAGLTEAELAGLHSPIGLDIGARTPEETSVSIAAEIIAVRTGAATGQSLSTTDGPIHPDAPDSALCPQVA